MRESLLHLIKSRASRARASVNLQVDGTVVHAEIQQTNCFGEESLNN